MLEAGGAAMFDQAVDLAHAGAGGNQHQWAVRQLGQVRVAERQSIAPSRCAAVA
jgi:hypothetical protein